MSSSIASTARKAMTVRCSKFRSCLRDTESALARRAARLATWRSMDTTRASRCDCKRSISAASALARPCAIGSSVLGCHGQLPCAGCVNWQAAPAQLPAPTDGALRLPTSGAPPRRVDWERRKPAGVRREPVAPQGGTSLQSPLAAPPPEQTPSASKPGHHQHRSRRASLPWAAWRVAAGNPRAVQLETANRAGVLAGGRLGHRWLQAR